MLPQLGSKFISLCFRKSAWFGLYVASQSDGVHHFGLDCQHPSLISVLDSSTMCGMFSRSRVGHDGHDYQYQVKVIGCNKSLPFVCEETQSGLFFQYFIKSLSLSLSLSLYVCVCGLLACLYVVLHLTQDFFTYISSWISFIRLVCFTTIISTDLLSIRAQTNFIS